MKAAHLENEINPFASAFCAPYAWSSRKGHRLRPPLLLLEMSIGRGHLGVRKWRHFEFESSKRIDRPSELPYSCIVPGGLLVLSHSEPQPFAESLI